jgi:5'-nucleotidase
VSRVLLDCDGVLADFCGGVFDLVFDASGVRLTTENLEGYDDIFEKTARFHPTKALKEKVSKPGFCTKLRPLAGARDGVDSLRRAGHDIVIVTSPWHSETWCRERVLWLKRHFEIPERDVIFAKRKDLVRGDLFVDDDPKHVDGYPGQALLWDQPYNRGYTGRYRARSWDHVFLALEP